MQLVVVVVEFFISSLFKTLPIREREGRGGWGGGTRPEEVSDTKNAIMLFSPHSHCHPGGAALHSPLATILTVHPRIASHCRPVSIEKRPRREHWS